MTANAFELHPQLAQDSIHLVDWPLCQVRVLNDANFPWFLLVPRINKAVEMIDLAEADQQQLWRESAFISHWLKAEYHADKLNIAAIGNKIEQLHVHHIARFRDDPAWPDPVWGKLAAQPLAEKEVVRLQQLFATLTV